MKNSKGTGWAIGISILILWSLAKSGCDQSNQESDYALRHSRDNQPNSYTCESGSGALKNYVWKWKGSSGHRDCGHWYKWNDHGDHTEVMIEDMDAEISRLKKDGWTIDPN